MGGSGSKDGGGAGGGGGGGHMSCQFDVSSFTGPDGSWSNSYTEV